MDGLHISPGTVSYYTRAAEQAQLDKALIDQFSDEELINKVKPHCLQRQFTATVKCEPDYVLIYQELKKKGVTLQLLHEEYQERQGKEQSYSYFIFCQRFRTWLKKQKPSLRMLDTGGEKIFVDYAGPTIAIYDAISGAIHQAKLFIGFLGASNYTYVEATLTRSIPD